MRLYDELLELRNSIINLYLYLTIQRAYSEKEIKIYNPHCSNWNKCERNSLNKDCFMCDLNLKGSEQYVMEKLMYRVNEILDKQLRYDK